MVALSKAVLASCATAAAALTLTACGGSSTSTSSSASMSSGMSSAMSSMTSMTAAAAAEGTLASVCTEIDGVMMGQPDANPAATAKQLEEIKAKVTTPDANLIGNLADAYNLIAANPADTDAQGKLQSSAKSLGAFCEMATMSPKPN